MSAEEKKEKKEEKAYLHVPSTSYVHFPRPLPLSVRIQQSYSTAMEQLKSGLVTKEEIVSFSKDDVKKVLDGNNTLLIAFREMEIREEKRSLSGLYIGVLLGALIGVIGNFFAAFWFQPLTAWSILGLVATGVILALLIIGLYFQARKYAG